MEINFKNAFDKELKLNRYPVSRDKSLRAWDAADELLLEELAQNENRNLSDKKILIINDSFGALGLSLIDYNIENYTDSYITSEAIKANCESNGLTPISISNDLEELKDLTEGSNLFDIVIIKLPKNLSFFEDILCHISKVTGPHSEIICAGMIKHMAKNSFDLLAKYIGETTTSLAKKKARLIFAKKQVESIESPFPIKLSIPSFKDKIVNHSNLFSREKLDIGTRFFLENIPSDGYQNILDLGCANGIIGIQAKKKNPSAKIHFSDVSYMAIKSAKQNFADRFPIKDCKLEWTNCYEGAHQTELDLVLCNPPFHQENTIGDFIAIQMFHDAHKALAPGGRIRVIGNRHLGYHVKLKKIFNNSEVITQNKKFVIIESIKK